MSRFGRTLSAEFRKVTATKIWWILAVVLAAYSAMMAVTFAFLFGTMSDQLGEGVPLPSGQETANMVYASVATFGYVVPLLVGSLFATGEIRHHILGLAFIAEPKRGIVLLSKTLVLLGVGALLGIAGLIGAVPSGAAVIGATGGEPMLGTTDTWSLITRVVAVIAVWAVIGFGIGLIVRNQAFAIVLALVFTQFLEPVLRAGAQFWDWSANIARFFPGAATDAFVGSSAMSLAAGDMSAAGGADPLSWWQGLLVLLVYVVVTIAAGWWLRWRRDVE
ncbi:ABC transporter permease [Leucobacter sp. CSA1]|uniref:ABC transporter permease n=1 Tax=Leucobacter chromiisoli TaxID=2796471 RepID=A0A934Q7J0_9MICO|nr:ABC transporter permease [Leucobacter chromiisoli]MBK0418795.1 ABC transporter permease [Leucobacter chromiisoli]